jgi:hypothetical protein
LESVREESIHWQFYAAELTLVKTEYLVDKMLDSGVRTGILEHLVR